MISPVLAFRAPDRARFSTVFRRHSRSQGTRAGFTLLEIIIVIALIGMLSALVVGGSVALLREHPVTAEDELRNAIARCRRDAVTTMSEVRLSFDAKARSFVQAKVSGETRLPIEMTGPLQVDFLPVSNGSTSLLGGDLVENEALNFVTFYPDGASSPFRVQLRTGGPARILRFDPWTCAEIAEAPSR